MASRVSCELYEPLNLISMLKYAVTHYFMKPFSSMCLSTIDAYDHEASRHTQLYILYAYFTPRR